MAASSVSNLISFFIPSKPPSLSPPKFQLTNLPLPSSYSSSSSKNRYGALLPIAASSNQRNHPSSSSSDDDDLIMSVVCPSLAHANTLFFRSAYNVQVIVEDNESEEKLLNRFKREVMRAGIIQECKRRRFFENKQDEVKRRVRDAAKRNRRRRTFRGAAQERQDGSDTPKAKKEAQGDEDNWEVPANLP